MPNFKIFQDNPDYARIKIFGNNNIAVNTDGTGNLGITSTGLAITPPSDGLGITSTGLAITPPTGGLAITPPTNGLSITSTGLAITPPTDGLAITSTGLAITPPTGGLTITSAGLAIATGTTDASHTIANISNTTGTADQTYDVLGVQNWTFAAVNDSTAANAQAFAYMQTSPDGTTWQNETSSTTFGIGSFATFVATTQTIKYARLFYGAISASSAITLNIYFQGQLS